MDASEIQRLTGITLKTCEGYIQKQAFVAFSKSCKYSRLPLDEYIANGWVSFTKALNTWRPDRGAKFNSYFTGVLIRDYTKMVVSSYYKKRYGKSVGLDNAEMAATNDPGCEAEYNMLLKEVKNRLSDGAARVFKQLTCPDPSLIAMAMAERKNAVPNLISKRMIIKYLNISCEDYENYEKEIHKIVADAVS